MNLRAKHTIKSSDDRIILTKDRFYNVLTYRNNTVSFRGANIQNILYEVKVKCDDGYFRYFDMSKFTSDQEWREQQLNKIGI
jgi:hypothetical protein